MSFIKRKQIIEHLMLYRCYKVYKDDTEHGEQAENTERQIFQKNR